MYSTYKSFIRYVTCKYFFPCLCYVFIFFMVSFIIPFKKKPLIIIPLYKFVVIHLASPWLMDIDIIFQTLYML